MKKTILINIDTTINNPVEIDKLIKIGDTVFLNIKIYENGVAKDLTNENVDISLKKSDGKSVETGIITTIGNSVSVGLGIQASNVAGDVIGEVIICNGSEQTTTNTFTFNVSDSVADVIIPSSVDDIKTLVDMMNTVDKGNELIEKYKVEIEEIGITAEAVEALNNIKSYIDVNLPALEETNNTAYNLKVTLENDLEDIIEENVRAETNIEEMKKFGDVTELTQNVTEIKTKTDKFAEDSTGKLMYNGEKVGGESTADKVTVTSIDGLTGDNVQKCLESSNTKLNTLNAKFYNIYDSASKSATYYVYQNNGSYSNDGTSPDKAFDSIAKAWAAIPIFFSGIINIKIIGDYTGSHVLEPKISLSYNSQILITSNDVTNSSTYSNLSGVLTFNNVNISGYGTTSTYPGLFFRNLKFNNGGLCFYNCNTPYIGACLFDSTTNANNYIFSYNSKCVLSANTFSGTTSSSITPVYISNFSNVFSINNIFKNYKNPICVYKNSNVSSSTDTFTNCTTKITKDNTSTYTLV